ncbi:hypothetical protein [Viridibacillus arvi]|uniref:hypothetical protein n=1 Tax=Viridibacillus arvi TaxID=263475 RepID=UPI0034CF4DB3
MKRNNNSITKIIFSMFIIGFISLSVNNLTEAKGTKIIDEKKIHVINRPNPFSDTVRFSDVKTGDTIKVYTEQWNDQKEKNEYVLAAKTVAKATKIEMTLPSFILNDGYYGGENKFLVTIQRGALKESKVIHYELTMNQAKKIEAKDIKVTKNKIKNRKKEMILGSPFYSEEYTIIVNNIRKGYTVNIIRIVMDDAGESRADMISGGEQVGATQVFNNAKLLVTGFRDAKGYFEVYAYKKNTDKFFLSAATSLQVKTKSINANDVKISNNKGKADSILVNNVKRGQQINVYNVDGKQIASKSAKGKSVILSIKQLGEKAGILYITSTDINNYKHESYSTAVKYKAE